MILYIFHSIIAIFLVVHVLIHVFFFFKKSHFYLRFIVSFAFFFLFCFYLVYYALLKKHFPLANPGEMLMSISGMILFIQLFIEWQTKEKTIAAIPVLLSFFCGTLGIASLHAFHSRAVDEKTVFFLSNSEYPIELFLYFVACVFLLYALGLSFFYRILFRVIKWQENFFLVHRLPSLKTLERYMIFFSLISLVFLFFVLFFRYFPYENAEILAPKGTFLRKNLLLSLMTWLTVGGTMWLRLSKRIDSNSVYYGLIVGVVFIVINFFWII